VLKVTCDLSSIDGGGKIYHMISFQDWENEKLHVSRIRILCGEGRLCSSPFSLIFDFVAVVTCSVGRRKFCNLAEASVFLYEWFLWPSLWMFINQNIVH